MPTNDMPRSEIPSANPDIRAKVLAKFGLGIVVVTALVIMFIPRGHHTTPSNTAITRPVARVDITAQGFLPTSITVSANTLVTWTNRDTQPHQVAADPYPKNNSIPNFNSTVVLQAGESYTYSFGKKGTYHYHDQLHPFQNYGTVTVR